MKITLKNFRCYENETFDFGKEGLILLSGCSGKGKTTIMLGIHFALFGTGHKLVTHDKLSCSVVLELDDMVITRTKRPNRLVLGMKNEEGDYTEYEDDSAQSIIDKKFGENFKTTGYISQNGAESFILMSPTDKLEFLERFAFNDANLSDINKRCKEVIKERQEMLTKTTSQLEMAIAMVNELKKPEKVEFPIKCTVKNRPVAIKNEHTGLKNSNTLIARNQTKINALRQEINAIQILDASLNSTTQFINTVEEKLKTVEKDKKEIVYIGDEGVLELENTLEKIVSQREVIGLQERYRLDLQRLNKLKEEELTSTYEKIQKIQTELWKDYTQDEVLSSIKKNKQTLKILDKICKLQEEMEKCDIENIDLNVLEKRIETEKNILSENKKLLEKLELQKEVYKCPCCDTSLKLQNSTLILFDQEVIDSSLSIENIQEIISKTKKSISNLETRYKTDEQKLLKYKEKETELFSLHEECLRGVLIAEGEDTEEERELPDYEEVESELSMFQEYLTTQTNLETSFISLKNTYDNKIFSRVIVTLEKGLNDMKRKIDCIIDDDNEFEETEEEIRERLSIQKMNKERLNILKNSQGKLIKEKEEYRQKIEEYKQSHIDVYTELHSIETLQSGEGGINEKLEENIKLEEKRKTHEHTISLIERFQTYEKELESYNSWLKKIDTVREEEIECRKQYGSAVELKEKILEAESIALLNIITCINTHAQQYLDAFFPENPISVKLVPFKESKKGKNTVQKPQINLQIEYKSMEATLDMLSQGENSRVVLAFFLALSEIFESPFILMDECTSNLDQELNTIVMDSIKENFEGKLAVVIAHQVVNGIFDNTINL
jgi:DNA repair exonuclease SbcCD ATPase subunit